MAPRWLVPAPVLLLLAALPAQESRLREIAARLATTEPGSLPWFELHCDRIDAELDIDVRQALASAKELQPIARASPHPGAAAVGAVLLAQVMTMAEGPLQARRLFDEAPALPASVAPSLRARYLLAKAYCECYQGRHSVEMELAVPGKAAAEASGNPVLKVRAAAMVAHILPERSASTLRTVFAALESAGQAAEVAHLRPLLVIEERAQAEERGDDAAVLSCEATLRQLATELGDRRLQALVLVHEANRLYRGKQADEALPIYEQAAALYEKLGERREVFGAQNMLTWAAMHRGDLDRAGALAEQNRTLLQGRGYAAEDKELLRTRFELALRHNDSQLALELRRQWDAHDGLAAEEERRATELRARIRAAEAEKQAAEQRLADERTAAENRLRRARTTLYATAFAGLGLLAAMTWRSRRRLLQTNRRLNEQIRRVEEGERIRAQLEARMRELERAESLGTLAAGVAHDFNNLLTGMLGNADLLRARADHGEDRELLDTIVSAGQQAGRLCKQLQQYAGGEPTRPEALDLGRLVTEMLPVLQAATRQQGNVRCEPPPPTIGVLADRGQLEQMLLNLVVNATDAGARTVTIGLGTAAGADGAPWAQLVVRDDGHGMTESVRQRIFDPFFTTRFPGRGLGLAVVYGAVRRHGGTIEVDSEPGQGTSFTIRLPLATAEVAVAEPVVRLPAVPPRAPGRLFVVDDELHVRVLLVRMLANLGLVATAVTNGHELLRLLATVPTGEAVTVFVDLTMPELDGPELTRRIRAQRPDTRIVLMSGHTEDHLLQVSERLHPDGVLAKPFRADQLEQVLATAHAGG